MAVIRPVLHEETAPGIFRYRWEGMASGDTGLGARLPHFPDKTFQFVSGTAPTTLAVEGSMDSTDGANGVWRTLHDAQGAAINLASAGNETETVLENPLWVRPSASGGAGANIVVVMVAAKKPLS